MSHLSPSDSIIKSTNIAAPRAVVWSALTDYEKFGSWFRVALDQPFVAGSESTGQMTYPGHEHHPWRAKIVAIEPMDRFAFDWPATGGDADAIGTNNWTHIEFVLEDADGDTRVTVTESGFTALSAERRERVMRSNVDGWEAQMRNIRAYVEG